MNIRRTAPKIGALMAAAGLILFSASPACAGDAALRISPQKIEIGTFFGGGSIKVSGRIPPGCAVVIELVGKEVEEELMRKGRRWDIWMNVDEIDIGGVPRVYDVMSSRADLLTTGLAEYPWGYRALLRSATFGQAPPAVSRAELFREFVRLKEGNGLYAQSPGKVSIVTIEPHSVVAQGTFRIPTRIAPGVYDVYLYIVRGDTVIERRHGSVDVYLVGLPALLDSLASANRALYGILAVAVAAAVGLLSGIAFKSKQQGPQDKTR